LPHSLPNIRLAGVFSAILSKKRTYLLKLVKNAIDKQLKLIYNNYGELFGIPTNKAQPQKNR